MPLEAWRAWRPVTYTETNPGPGQLTKSDILAIKAVKDGTATADQQARAFKAIVYQIAGMNEMSFRADDHGGERETAFAEGKRFVGQQIMKAATVPLSAWTGKASEHGNG